MMIGSYLNKMSLLHIVSIAKITIYPQIIIFAL